MIRQFEHFFKPEVRNAADELVSEGRVFLKIGSDKQIDASVRGTTPVQVAFRSQGIAAKDFTVDCSCKASLKGQLCKHIWATLVTASEKQPDFFAEKQSLDKVQTFANKSKPTRTPEQLERDASFKAKQAAARKQQYEQQKQRAKANKPSKPTKPSKSTASVPEHVQAALKYFETNGFTLALPIDEAEVNSAKRVLSRVFHPDKGGSQEEALELLRNAETLLKHR